MTDDPAVAAEQRSAMIATFIPSAAYKVEGTPTKDDWHRLTEALKGAVRHRYYQHVTVADEDICYETGETSIAAYWCPGYAIVDLRGGPLDGEQVSATSATKHLPTTWIVIGDHRYRRLGIDTEKRRWVYQHEERKQS